MYIFIDFPLFVHGFGLGFPTFQHISGFFNWYSTDLSCSPFALLHQHLKSLWDRRQSRPQRRYWNAQPAFEDGFEEDFAHLYRETRFKHFEDDSTFSWFQSRPKMDGIWDGLEVASVNSRRYVHAWSYMVWPLANTYLTFIYKIWSDDFDSLPKLVFPPRVVLLKATGSAPPVQALSQSLYQIDLSKCGWSTRSIARM